MAKQAKDPERQARAKQTKAEMIARGWLSDDGITWLHHERGGSLYLVAGDGRVKVGKTLTGRLGIRLAEHAANGLTQVVWTLDYRRAATATSTSTRWRISRRSARRSRRLRRPTGSTGSGRACGATTPRRYWRWLSRRSLAERIERFMRTTHSRFAPRPEPHLGKRRAPMLGELVVRHHGEKLAQPADALLLNRRGKHAAAIHKVSLLIRLRIGELLHGDTANTRRCICSR